MRHVAPPTSKSKGRAPLALFDFLWAVAAPGIALALREPRLIGLDPRSAILIEVYQYIVISIACAVPCIALFRLSESMTRFFSTHDLKAIVGAATTAASVGAVITFMFNRLDAIPRSTPLIYAFVLMLGFAGARLFVAWRDSETAGAAAAGDVHLRRILVVGVDRFASHVFRLVQCQDPRTVQIVAALDERERLSGRSVHGVVVVGSPADLPSTITEYAVHGVLVDEVWASDELLADPEIAETLSTQCENAGIVLSSIATALNLTPRRANV